MFNKERREERQEQREQDQQDRVSGRRHGSHTTPLRDRWTVKVSGGPDLEVQGNILDHEYSIGEGRNKLAEISKRWVSFTDGYGVEIEPGHNDAAILAITVAIDRMAHG